jgi:hypothetical protein
VIAALSSAAACFDFDYLMLEFWLSDLWLFLSIAELLALLLPVSAGTIWLSLLGWNKDDRNGDVEGLLLLATSSFTHSMAFNL